MIHRFGKYHSFDRQEAIYIAFTDIRDAVQALDQMSRVHKDWKVKYVSMADFEHVSPAS